VHASRDKVYRLVPRANPAVNKFWMCDEGRFTYKRLHTADRTVVPRSENLPVEWDRALEDAAKKLKAALDKGPGNVGVVFNAQSTNEDLYALSRLCFDHLKIDKAYLAGYDEGWSDQILVSADKNPNTAGAKGIGGTKLRSLLDLSRDLKSGAIKALLVVGGHGVLGTGDKAAAGLPLANLEALVVASSHNGALTEAAHVVLPLADWAESDGTFTNKLGMVQRIRAALPAPGDALPGWEILAHLAHKLGIAMDYANAKQVFTEAREKLAFMRGADWGRPFLPVQLRFANTRG
jgi:NADH-quinone oxidoreductase subunit G